MTGNGIVERMKKLYTGFRISILAALMPATFFAQTEAGFYAVSVQVHAASPQAPIYPNLELSALTTPTTSMPQTEKLLSELARLSPVPVTTVP